MDIYDLLTMLGGLAMFLFGMNTMSGALEKRAGSRLKFILSSMTSTTFKAFLLGTAVTAVVQSSSATTVMLVGLVNSGIMSLQQSVGVTMGANLGAVGITWLLSLTSIQGDSLLIQLCKPSTFTPVLAMIGIIFYMFQKNPKRKDTGLILLGFALLMFGMDTMSGAVDGLQDNAGFIRMLTLFDNPLLGVLVGTAFTMIIQSSGASIGILQALSVTGTITYGAAIPIIMGQNIGTCISALLSSVGTSKDGRRTAMVHLFFNVLATVVLLPLYLLVQHICQFPIIAQATSPLGIAVVTLAFKLLALALLMPVPNLLVKLATLAVPDREKEKKGALLDERLLTTPAVAVARCHEVTTDMAGTAAEALQLAFQQLWKFDWQTGDRVRALENTADEYEDQLGTYLVRLSNYPLSEQDSTEVNRLLHMIGDLERISDHAVNILESAEEVHSKDLKFSDEAKHELEVMIQAVLETLDLSISAFRDADLHKAAMVEPLEQVVDDLKDVLKSRHIQRLQRQECTIELGFVLTDLLTNLERISDHCSNIAGCMLEMAHEDMDLHAYLRQVRLSDSAEYHNYYDAFSKKYDVSGSVGETT